MVAEVTRQKTASATNWLNEISVSNVINSNTNAKVAQLVERHLAKVEVAGSNPVFRSN